MSGPTVAQRMASLGKANEARFRQAVARRELASGGLSLVDAFVDERLGPMMVFDLLRTPPMWGPMSARRVLRRAQVPGHRRVRELTARQRQELLRCVAGLRP